MDAEHVVDLGYACYRGRKASARSVVYLGIPYALPPIGHRRFRKPEPVDTTRPTSRTVVDAAEYPAFALQGALGLDDIGGAGSEDCLKVDVYAPSSATATSALPVLVYIHGGGYKFGAPKNWPFHHWIDRHPDIIVVSIYYRLSVLGFLAHPEFVSSGLADLNVGIHDQLLALSWIKQHIVHFGGDPAKVTICGQSAGASSIQLLLIACHATNKNLFRSAIAQSVYRTPVCQPSEKQEIFVALLKELGCSAQDLHGQMECLRSKNPIELMQASDIVGKIHATVLGDWKPVLDGDLLTDYPTRLMKKGLFADVPIIIGATSDETPWGSELSPWARLFGSLWPNLSPVDVRQIASTYQDEPAGLSLAAGDAMFRSPTLIFTESCSKSWVYRFNEPASSGPLVHHSADNWFMFKGARTGPNASVTFDDLSVTQQAFADELIAFWVSFVRDTDPNTKKLTISPYWPQYASHNSVRLSLQASGSTVEDFPESERTRYRIWMDHSDGLQN